MPGKRWIAWEIEQLKMLLARGLAASEMVIGMRTQGGIRSKAAKLGLVGDGVSRRPWASAAEVKLQQLIGRGLQPADIVRENLLPGYSRTAICSKASRLGLVDPERARRVRAATRLTQEQRVDLHLFLHQYYLRCTPEQISRLWNNSHRPRVTRRQVVYHLEQVGLKLPWREVMCMEYSRAKRRQRSPRQIKSQQLRWKRYRQTLTAKLMQLAQAARRRHQGRYKRTQQRTCAVCRETWPAIAPFFLIAGKKKTRAGWREYVGQMCRLCWNEQRRRASKVRRTTSSTTPAS